MLLILNSLYEELHSKMSQYVLFSTELCALQYACKCQLYWSNFWATSSQFETYKGPPFKTELNNGKYTL